MHACAETDVSTETQQHEGSVPIPEHLAQARFLVRPDNCGGLEINLEVRVDGIVAEIILLQHRILELVAPFFDILLRVTGQRSWTCTDGYDSRQCGHH